MSAEKSDVMYRPYVSNDEAACLKIFRGNVPKFFDAAEEAEFQAFLQDHEKRADYYVIEKESLVIACGGCFMNKNGIGGMAWGMVASEYHRGGYGSMLLERRIETLRQKGAKAVKLDTSQHSRGFFERFGFEVTAVKKDSYGPGLDQHDMELLLK
jgi:N-acetylglutamate synthase-like GNAT family acetyltransferase